MQRTTSPLLLMVDEPLRISPLHCSLANDDFGHSLHSRQKKKMHTEKLEEENLVLASKIAQSQHRITNLQIKVDDHEKEREGWRERQAKTEDRLRRMRESRDAKAEENEKLVKEVAALRSQLRSTNSSTPTTSRSGSTGYGECTTDLNNCTLNNVEWQQNTYDFIDDICMESGLPAGKHEGSRG